MQATISGRWRQTIASVICYGFVAGAGGFGGGGGVFARSSAAPGTSKPAV